MAVGIPALGLDCSKCDEAQKKEHGFYEDSKSTEWELGEWVSRRCPLTQVTPQSMAYLRAYRMFQLGYLPNGRGWMKESNKFIEAMDLIASELANMGKDNARSE